MADALSAIGTIQDANQRDNGSRPETPKHRQ